MLPKQLQDESLGFVKLKSKSKIPFEKEWQRNPYKYAEISVWAAAGNNYGVMGGVGNLVIIDTDETELSAFVFKQLPETFTVKTLKGFHFYYVVPVVEKKIVLSKDGKHFGEIISHRSQVVGPNCRHPSGILYTVERDSPIHKFS